MCVCDAREDVRVDGRERRVSVAVDVSFRGRTENQGRSSDEDAPSPPTAKVRTPVRVNALPGLDAIEARRADVARRPRRSASAMA
jgi:hypothetical protein